MLAVEKITAQGWENCVQIRNEYLQIIITTEVGPRIISASRPGGENVLKVYESQAGRSGGERFIPYGGHRYWTAPEADSPWTYFPDNHPVDFEIVENGCLFNPAPEQLNGLCKKLHIELSPSEPLVKITHTTLNVGHQAVNLAPWALTVMCAGGVAAIPQEPFIPHGEKLLPARPLVLWNYTKMSDPRFHWGEQLILFRQSTAPNQQKIGVWNSAGWLAYLLKDDLFLKYTETYDTAVYPDMGCSHEVYTDPGCMELESLGPLISLEVGEKTELVEYWTLLPRSSQGDSEKALFQELTPVVENFLQQISVQRSAK